jgi:hypothetical protein
MYIGNDLQIAHPSYKIIDDISSGFNGSTTSFALQVSGATPVPFPISTQQVMISVNGVVQEPDPNGSAGFKLLGSNIVFSSAPANGHAFFGVINAGADYVTAGSEFPDGSATAPSFTFQDDQDTGWFRSGSGAVGFSANGVNTIGFDGNGLTVTGDATFTGDSSKNMVWDKSDGALEFANNAKASFGGALSIYHDGSHSFIADTGTGNLRLGANDLRIQTDDFSENYIIGTKNDAVHIYFDGSPKISTTNTGATITGTLVADGLTVDTNTLHVDATNNRVGIGLTAPATNLHIKAASPILRLEDSTDPQGDGGSIGKIEFYGNDGSSGAVDVRSYIQTISTNATGNSHALTIGIGAANNAPTEVLRVDDAGRLLLGTTADLSNNDTNALLQVFTSTSAKILLGRSDTSISSGNYLGMVDFHGTDGTSSQRCARVGAVASGDHATDDKPTDLVFQTCADGAGTSVERMRIDSAGKIGINETSPDVALHIKNTSSTFNQASLIKAENTTTGQGSYMLFQNSTDSTAAYVGLDGAGYFNVDAGSLLLTTATGDPVVIATNNGTERFRVTSAGNATATGTVSDSKGNLRSIPLNLQSSTYTLVASDAGKHVRTSANVTIPNNVFAAGDAVTIINQHSNPITLTQASGVTLWNAADGSYGNRALATRGMVSLIWTTASIAYISGAGLS